MQSLPQDHTSTVSGTAYGARALCLTRHEARTSRWTLFVTRLSDGQQIGAYRLILSRNRFNVTGLPGVSTWEAAYQQVIEHAAAQLAGQVAA